MSGPIGRVQLATVMTVDRNGVDPIDMDPTCPFVGLEHIYADGRIDPSQTVGSAGIRSTKHRFTPNHILFGRLRPYLRKIAAPDFDGVCSTDIIPLLPTSAVDKRFLLHWLRTDEIVDLATNASAGANLPRLSPTALLRFEIPLPPLDEQKRIAAVLDKAAALRRHRQETLQLNEVLLRSVFLQMFGDPVRNSKQLPVKALEGLATLERGKFTPRPRNDPSYYGGKHPFIQTGDIAQSQGRITSWTQTLNDKGAAVSKEFGPGTVVIAIVGATLGETAIVETPVYCPDSIIGITPYPDQSTPEFIEFLLRLWKPRLKQLAPDAARANLNLERLRPLLAVTPPIEEQREFSRIVRMQRLLWLEHQESLIELNRLYLSLQQGAFRGELDLSRLVLDAREPSPAAIGAKTSGVQATPDPVVISIVVPEFIRGMLERLDDDLERNDRIPWSVDYFKYRILGVQPVPFDFDDVMRRAETVFEEAPYEEIKDIMFDLLGKGGSPALLRQSFELEADGRDQGEGRKGIVFVAAT